MALMELIISVNDILVVKLLAIIICGTMCFRLIFIREISSIEISIL